MKTTAQSSAQVSPKIMVLAHKFTGDKLIFINSFVSRYCPYQDIVIHVEERTVLYAFEQIIIM